MWPQLGWLGLEESIQEGSFSYIFSLLSAAWTRSPYGVSSSRVWPLGLGSPQHGGLRKDAVLSRSKKWKLRPLSRTGTTSSILNGSKSHRGSPYSRERRKRFHVLMCDEWQVPMQKNTQNGRCGSAHFWKSQFTARGAESG